MAFALLGVVQNNEVLSGTFVWDERFSEYIPWRVEAARLLRDGEFPFFTDRVFGGMPLFTAAYTGVLYPPNWLYLFLPIQVANWLAALHTLVGGMGMMTYLRRAGTSAFAAFAGALFFACGTFGLIHEPHVAMREAAMLAPWVAWAAARALDHDRWRAAVPLALLLALQLAVGYWQVTLFTLAWIAVECGARWRRNGEFARATLRLAAAMALGAGLMAALLLPTVAHVAQTPRGEMTIDHWQEGSFPPSHAIIFVMPRALGTAHTGWSGGQWAGELLVTVTPIASALAMLTLLMQATRWRGTARRRLVWALWIGVAVSGLLALGRFFPPNALLFHIPPFNLFRVPARWLFLTTTFVTILAAFSVDELIAHAWHRRVLLPLAAWLAMAGVLVAFFLALWERPDGVGPLDLLRAAMVDQPRAAWLYVVLAGWLALLALPRRVQWVAAAIAMLLAATEYRLMEDTDRFPPATHRVVLEQGANPLLADAPPENVQRLYALYVGGGDPHGLLLPHNTHLYLGYRGLGGYTPLHSALLADCLPLGQDGRTWQNEELLLNPAPLAAMGVTHLLVESLDPAPELQAAYLAREADLYLPLAVHDGRWALLEIRGAAPRFQLASAWRPADEAQMGEALWNGQASGAVALLPAANTPPDGLPPPGEPLGQGTVEVLEAAGSRQHLRVTADAPGLLIVRDVHWRGWSATIRPEGTETSRPAEVFRANALMRGIIVPAGTSDVELSFKPPWFWPGIAISGMGAGVLAALLAGPFFRRRSGVRNAA